MTHFPTVSLPFASELALRGAVNAAIENSQWCAVEPRCDDQWALSVKQGEGHSIPRFTPLREVPSGAQMQLDVTHFPTVSLSFTSERALCAAVNSAIENSQWFAVEPRSDDQWALSVKQGEDHSIPRFTPFKEVPAGAQIFDPVSGDFCRKTAEGCAQAEGAGDPDQEYEFGPDDVVILEPSDSMRRSLSPRIPDPAASRRERGG